MPQLSLALSNQPQQLQSKSECGAEFIHLDTTSVEDAAMQDSPSHSNLMNTSTSKQALAGHMQAR